MPRTAIPAHERDGGWEDVPADQVSKDEEIDLLALADELEAEFAPPEDAGGDDVSEPEGLEVVFKAGKAGDTAKRLSGLIASLTRAVNAMKGLGEKPLTPAIGKALKTVAQGLTLLAGEKEADVSKVSGEVVQAATTALEKLMALGKSLQEMDKSADVPDAAMGQMKGIAGILASILAQNEAPPGDKGKPPSEEEQKGKKKEGEEDDKKKEGEKDKKKEGEKDKKGEVAKAGDDDPIVVFKAGAKMRRARLSRFRKAVTLLSELLKELEGEPPDEDPKGKGKDKKKTTKGEASIAPEWLERITKATEDLSAQVEESSSKTREQVEALAKRLDEIENVRPTGEGDGDPPEPIKKEESLWGNVVGTRRAS